jgi:hypothetical protein
MIIGSGHATESEIRIRLYDKYAQLGSIDKKEDQDKLLKNVQQDYFDSDAVAGKYDKNDYERVLDKFKSMDSNVRAHEQTHAALADTTSSIQYNYQMGPDGKMYATGGSVRLDTSMPTDPEAAMAKMDELKRSATSSGSDMSSADSNIAIQANLMKMKLQLQEDGNSI